MTKPVPPAAVFDKKPPRMEANQCDLSGMALENAVRREVGLSVNWTLDDMQELLLWMEGRGVMTSLYRMRIPEGGWGCTMHPASLPVVQGPEDSPADAGATWEFGNMPSTAVARSALVTVRTWCGNYPEFGGCCQPKGHKGNCGDPAGDKPD